MIHPSNDTEMLPSGTQRARAFNGCARFDRGIAGQVAPSGVTGGQRRGCVGRGAPVVVAAFSNRVVRQAARDVMRAALTARASACDQVRDQAGVSACVPPSEASRSGAFGRERRAIPSPTPPAYSLRGPARQSSSSLAPRECSVTDRLAMGGGSIGTKEPSARSSNISAITDTVSSAVVRCKPSSYSWSRANSAEMVAYAAVMNPTVARMLRARTMPRTTTTRTTCNGRGRSVEAPSRPRGPKLRFGRWPVSTQCRTSSQSHRPGPFRVSRRQITAWARSNTGPVVPATTQKSVCITVTESAG